MKFFRFHEHSLKKGIILVLLGWLSLTTSYAIVKAIENYTTVPTMLFFRNLFGGAFLLPWVIAKWPKSMKVKCLKIVLFRSVMGLLNLFFIFMAIDQISLVNTTLLNNSAPFFVPFILWFWIKAPINHKLWPAVLLGFIGIALVLEPDERIFNIGAFYGILAGLCLAFTIVTMRMTTHDETMRTFLSYFYFVGLAATLPFALMNWKIETGWILIGLISLGLFSALGQICLFQGLKFAKAYKLAPFSYSSVIFAGLFEWVFWGVIPKPVAYLGMLFIIASGAWIVWISRTPKHAPK